MASEKQNSETFALLRYATILNSNSDNANKLLIFPSFLLLSLSGPFREPEGAGYACVNAWYIAKTLLFFPSVPQGVLLGLLIYWRSAAYARYLAPVGPERSTLAPRLVHTAGAAVVTGCASTLRVSSDAAVWDV